MIDMIKCCCICKVDKSVDQFSRCILKNGAMKISGKCKTCKKIYDAEYQIKNKEKIALRKKLKKDENPDITRQQGRRFYFNNKQKRKAYYKEWVKNNPTYSKKYTKEYRKIPTNKIAANFRSRLNKALKGKNRLKSMIELTGCSIEHLINHLESKFTVGMTWDNYGIGGWEIDHILPCSSFDLTIPENQLKCFNYTNLQPLWVSDNRSKSNKVICKPKVYGWSRSQSWENLDEQKVNFCNNIPLAWFLM